MAAKLRVVQRTNPRKLRYRRGPGTEWWLRGSRVSGRTPPELDDRGASIRFQKVHVLQEPSIEPSHCTGERLPGHDPVQARQELELLYLNVELLFERFDVSVLELARPF